MRVIIVAQDGSGDFTSVQSAINAVRVLPLEPVTIQVKNGVYFEKITIPDNKPTIRLIGESREETIIAYDDYAKIVGTDGEEIGTFRTAVVKVEPNDFLMENLTIHNTAGFGPDIAQAVALYTSGDRQVYRNIRLLGNQDTLYTSRGRQYFEQCYIEGHVDFIFGSASVWFEACDIHSLREGYITAASTPKEHEFGYVFHNCRLTGVEEKESVYLGRPWRPWGHTVFIDTWMGPHIHAVGWDCWDDVNNESTSRFGEYGSSGPGANLAARVQWADAGTLEQAQGLSVKRVLGGHDHWNPLNA